MEKNKNLNSMEVAEAGDIYLHFSGLLNWDKYRHLTYDEVKEWVEEDTKKRANEWVNKHFKEEPFNGMLYIDTIYVCLNWRFNKKDTVVAQYELSCEKNKFNSCEEEDFKIIPEEKK